MQTPLSSPCLSTHVTCQQGSVWDQVIVMAEHSIADELKDALAAAEHALQPRSANGTEHALVRQPSASMEADTARHTHMTTLCIKHGLAALAVIPHA